MAQNGSGASLIVGAAILGMAIIGSAFLIGQSVDNATVALGEVKAELAKAPTAAAPAAAPTGGRPDANRVYKVDVGPSPVKGAAKAPITIVEFSDFQCPFCSRVNPTLTQIEKQYGDKVKIAFKHLPLSFHTKAEPAHLAAEAAHRQGKFWEMHDKIFGDQKNLSEEAYIAYAEELGLDLEKFKKDVASSQVKQSVKTDQALAASLGVTGTPGFFVNGRFLRGAQPFESFKKLIDEELAKKS